MKISAFGRLCLPVTYFILAAGAVAYHLAARTGALPPHRSTGPSGTGTTQALACGTPDDQKIHLPPEWDTFTPPPVGHRYTDPVFGCQVKRLTDSGVEETAPDGTRTSLMHSYSTFSPLNANDTMLLLTSDAGSWHIRDTNGNVVVRPDKMPVMNNGHPVWDASDGNAFYYTHGNSLYQAKISANSVTSTVEHTFDEYGGIVSPDAADLSQDGDHIALAGQNSNKTMDIFVWSLGSK